MPAGASARSSDLATVFLMRNPMLSSSNSRPAEHAGRSLFRAIAVMVPLLSLNLPAAESSPPAGPTVNLNEPVAVTVTNPVEVQGSVEVVNDALKTPFLKSVAVTINAGFEEVENTPIALPANKRLVIEAITVSVNGALGQTGWATLGLGGARAHLATQIIGSNSFSTRSIGTHAFKARVNTSQTPQLGLQVQRTNSTGIATFTVSLFGYTEDL